MTEGVSEIEVSLSQLEKSKLYALARSVKLLEFLEKDLPFCMEVETELDAVMQRTPEDADHTRIFLNYTNVRSKSVLFNLRDPLRLDRQFDVDNFLAGYAERIKDALEESDQVAASNFLLAQALTMAASTVLGLDPQLKSGKVREVAENVLTSIVSVLFNDPLDVIILIEDRQVPGQPNAVSTLISGMWVVKNRSEVSGELTLIAEKITPPESDPA